MSLTPGTRFGAYEVGSQIGQGGMGQVFRATDTTLGRVVAIKILPEAFAGDPDRLARFEREARTLAALNHPHIASIYAVEKSETGRALIMEFVDGEDLAQRIARPSTRAQGVPSAVEGRGLPLDEAMAIARQIVDALEAAHAQGIVHRDLKPANIRIRPDGAVKVLDFGLAKGGAGESGGAGRDFANSPTLTSPAQMTGIGMILGTAAYMAPEQAKGRAVDARADIWAFGAVLYEMLTGRRAFDGDDVTDVLGAVVRLEPDWNALPASTPRNIRTLLRRCLQKDPKQRLPHIGIARIEIDERDMPVAEQQAAPAGAGASRRRTRTVLALGAMAGMVIAALAVSAFLYFQRTPPAEQVTFSIDMPAVNLTQLSVSPDGRYIAFAGQVSSNQSTSQQAIFVRDLASGAVRQLPGTEGGANPFWAPDSRRIAYFAAGKLRTAALDGGGSTDILTTPTGVGTWGSQGTILFSGSAGLTAVAESGGASRTIEVDTGPTVGFPQFLPDGSHFLYSSSNGIHVGSLDATGTHLVLPVLSSSAYADPGYVVFQDGGQLFAQALDSASWNVKGERIQLADNVFINYASGRSAFSLSARVLAYRSFAGAAATTQFSWYTRGGSSNPVGKAEAFTGNFDLSPDSQLVAASIVDGSSGTSSLWALDMARGGAATLLTNDAMAGRNGRDVVWAPDGQRLGYSTRSEAAGPGGRALVERDVRGLDAGHPLLSGPEPRYIEDWSKDDKYIVFTQPRSPGGGGAGVNFWLLPLAGDRKPYPFLETSFDIDEPHFSWDTRWLAYSSRESGMWQIVVVSLDKKQRRQVSIDGGIQPRWRRDGRELYFLSGDGQMMAVDLTTGDRLDSGTPRRLFGTRISSPDPIRDEYAVTPDGERFLVLEPVAQGTPSPMTVVVNWARMLKP